MAGLHELVDDLDTMIAGARAIPLTDEVRVERRPALKLVDELRRAVADSGSGSAVDAATRLAAVVSGARRVPLTSQIRLDRVQVYDLLDRLRAAEAEAEQPPT